MSAAPVADNDSVEAPFAFQQVLEQVLIVAVVFVLIEIIGSHKCPDMSFLNSCLESGEVNLMQGTVGDLHIDLMAILLVVVQAEVLDAS